MATRFPKRRNKYGPPRPLSVVKRTVDLPREGARIVVVADTHSKPHPETFAQLRAEAPALLLHAGDIGDLSVLEDLKTIAPLIAVRGNIDGRDQTPPDVVELTLHRGRGHLKVLLTHIAVRGPRLRADMRRRAEAFGAQVVVCGHSHVPLIARDGNHVVFNPGSCGPRRFVLPILYGVMDFGPDGLSMRHMDIETGLRWQPPASPQAIRRERS